MTDAPVVKVEAKPLQKSLTMLFNLLPFLGGLLLLIQQSGLTLPASVVGALSMAIGAINWIIRFRTKQPIAMSLTPQTGEAPAPPWDTDRLMGPPRGLPR